MASPHFEPWYRYHFTRCVRLAQRKVNCDNATAQDMAQESFLYLFEQHQETELPVGGDLSRLLRTHLHFVTLDHLHARRHPVRGAVSLDAPLPDRKEEMPYHSVMPAPGPSVEDTATIHETYQEVTGYLATLPQLYREVLMQWAVGFTRREILVHLQSRHPGATERHLKNAFEQARLRLRTRRTARHLVDQAQFVCQECGRKGSDGITAHAKGLCKRCYERIVVYPRQRQRRSS